MEHLGKITYLGKNGIGKILEEGEDGFTYRFSFQVIDGYHGESVQELREKRIFTGAVVKFTRDEKTRVFSIKPVIWRV